MIPIARSDRSLFLCLSLFDRRGLVFSSFFLRQPPALNFAEGSVLDPTQSIVPGVNITLRNESTSKEWRTASTPEGFYRFSELAPGTYSLVAKKPGFADLNINNVHLAGESVTGVDLHLQTAQVSSSITVSGESSGALQTEQANCIVG